MSKKKNKKTAPQPIAKAKAIVPEKQTNNNRLFLFLTIGLLATVTYFFYLPALDNDFVNWDDSVYVLDNDLVRPKAQIGTNTGYQNATVARIPSDKYNTTVGDIFKKPVSLNYHPLTVLTMRWNSNYCKECLHSISAKPFIKWNIILHILNTILVLFLALGLTKKNLLASAVVAAIFALHPMHVESVAWVSERKDVLYTFFLLLGLLAYSQYLKKPSTKWLAITFGLFILSCLSKAMAVIFPLLMLLLYWYHQKSATPWAAVRQTLQFKNFKHTLPFFGVALFFGMLASNVQAGGNFHEMLDVAADTDKAINDFGTFNILERLQFASYGFLEYIIQFVYPHQLSTFHVYPTKPEFESSIFMQTAPLLFILILAAAIYSIKYTKSIAVGIGFYFITVALVLQFVSVGVVITADRYTYLPYIGLSLMLVLLVVQYAPTNKIQQGLLASLLIASLGFGFLTSTQVDTWQDSETLWTNVLIQHTDSKGRLHQNMEQPLSTRGNSYGKLAEYYRIKGNQQQTAVYIEKAFQDFLLAEKMGSKRAMVYEGLGNTYGMRGQTDKAIASFTKALQSKDLTVFKKGTIYFNIGVTHSKMNQHPEAIAAYSEALKFAPSNAELSFTYRGISYIRIGQPQAAIADFRAALKINPNNQLAANSLKGLMGN